MPSPYRNPLLEDSLLRPNGIRPPAPYRDPLLDEEEDPAFHVERSAPYTPPPMEEPPLRAPDLEMSPLGGPSRMTRPPVDDQIRAEPIDPFESDYNDALARRSQHAASKPIVGSKQYERPTWQKLLLMGASGAAGYVNAGGRAHVQGPSEALLRSRPRYDTAMDQWTADGRAIDSDINAMQTKYQMGRQANQDVRSNRRDDAYINAQNAIADDRREIKTRPPADVNMGEIGMWDPVKKRIYPGTAKTPKPEKPTRQEEFAEWGREADQMVAQGLLKRGTPEYVFYRANGKMPNQQRPRGPGKDPNAPAPRSTFTQITNRKKVDLMRAQSEYDAAFAATTVQSERDTALAILNQKKKMIQESYENSIIDAGGSVDFPVTGAAPPPPAPGDVVRIQRPDGKKGTIPRANLAAAKAAGAVELP